MKKHLLPSLAIAAFVLFGGLATAQDITVTHAQGETTLAQNPETVFSFDYASIDTLTTLGVHVDGAPPLAGLSPDWVPEGMTEIGSLFEPDYEVINAEQPDLVIIGGRSAEAYPQLSRLANTIDLTFGDDLYGSLQENTRTLAAIFGKEAEAEAALAELQVKVDALAAQVEEGGHGMLLMVSGGSLSLLSPSNARSGRGALLFDTLGLEPTIPETDTAAHGEPVSFEFLLRYDPDWLFVIDRDAAIGTGEAQPAAAVLDNELMHQTSVWQNDRIVYLDPFNWYIIAGAGLTSANEMIDALSNVYSR